MITDRARLDARLREALATFAPCTYFADFWDSEGHNVAEFDDNTDTILLRFSTDKLALVTKIVGPDRVHPFTPRRPIHSRMLDRMRRPLRPGHGVRA